MTEVKGVTLAVIVLIGLFLVASSYTGGIEGFKVHMRQTIIAISGVNINAQFNDILTEMPRGIGPTFFVWREGASSPTTIALGVGASNVNVRVAPGEKITWAAGSYGCVDLFYWDKQEVEIGNADTPLQVQLYRVPNCSDVSIQIFDSSYHEMTNGRYNMTVGTGEDVNLEVAFDVTEQYAAIREPHICLDYNVSEVQDVNIAGLRDSSVPRRIVSGLDQCFYTKLDYYLYNETKLRYDVTVKTVSGVDPTAKTSQINWYIIDKDLWYQDGKMYFVNPITNANMGAGSSAGNKGDGVTHVGKGSCDWNVSTWFA